MRPDFSSATFFVGLNMGAANPPSAAVAAMARCHSRQLAEPRRMGSLGNEFSDDMGGCLEIEEWQGGVLRM